MISFALHLAGAVALLLWAVRLIRTGVERGFMVQLRTGLRRAGQSLTSAAFGGAVGAFFLQSSTAVAILATGFAATGALEASAGLALLLGADVGSAIVAQVLIFKVGVLIPILLVVGAGLFLRAQSRPFKEAGRILIGLALVFISLSMIRVATEPLKDSLIIEMIMTYLARDLLSAFIIGAVFAWAMHSSVAAVLTFVTIVAEGLLPVPAASAMVLGANLGGALIPYYLTLAAPRPARMIIIGNIALRGGGAAIALTILAIWSPDMAILGKDAFRQIINLHLLFNLAVAILALPLISPFLRLLDVLLPKSPAPKTSGQISALDDSALSNPERALACAAREVLRMGEAVHEMLTPALDLFRQWDADVAKSVGEKEDMVDKMHFTTKLYIARLQQSRLNAEQSRRAMDIVTFANNLEDAGDQISTNLLEQAREIHNKGLSFSDDGWRDLTDFHDRVLNNAQLALNVMMTRDQNAALQLVEEKDQVRQAEQAMQASHLDRLRNGNQASIETSNLHQETLRALKHVNTSFSFAAYPIVEEAGVLLSSRLSTSPNGS